MNPIELAASHNRWSALPTAEKLLLFGGLLVAALLVPPPVGHAVILAICAACALVLARVPARVYVPALLAPVVFLLLGTGPLIWDLVDWRFVVDPAGVDTAWRTVSRASAATATTITLACTTPVADLLAAGRRAGLPGPLAHVVDTTYRLIGILIGTTRTLRQAHDLRLGNRTARAAISSVGTQFASVFVLAVTRARAIDDAMSMRAERGETAVLAPARPVSPARVAVIGVVLVAVAALGVVT
ncbi:energy-coupling factor transporter transmembrane protein EcfT [Dietzia sp. ANT_WB102]|uniref:energy-coupling factor transporter transmembrane component T family protein n=1 Tax=Dietzia sp. ANT_WB102 TaxID=2597345 RepID=UPI0011EF6454|nr:energy-coupling factor transporter transmembrane component T [Dietzia sp. ANT_WB102]KAA0918941.1 cobalt ECF transporter T component CbiQ [Dietzia sp. ANT_WB102]